MINHDHSAGGCRAVAAKVLGSFRASPKSLLL
jgi:hypothetical protein